KTLPYGDARHIHELTRHEMIGGNYCSDWDKITLLHAEFRELALRLHLREREVTSLRLVQAVGLAGPGSKLQRDIAILVLAAVSDNLAGGEAQHRERHMLARVRKDASHADLLRDSPGTHAARPVLVLCSPLTT